MKCSTVSLLVLCGSFMLTYAEEGHSKFEPKPASLYDPSDEATLGGYAGFQAYFFYRNQVRTTYLHGMLGQTSYGICIGDVSGKSYESPYSVRVLKQYCK